LKLNKIEGIKIFALIEISIGGLTLSSTIASILLHTSIKPLNILTFVLITSLISLFIGFGLLFKKSLAVGLLRYFAFSIILTKILIFAKIIYLNGALETNIPADIKNFVSIIYHSLILWYFNQKNIKLDFEKTKR